MGRGRTRLAQIEEISGLSPGTGIAGALAIVIATSVATALWGMIALAIALSGVAIMVALTAWANLVRLHREHRALLEVITDLTALVVTSPERSSLDSSRQSAVAPRPPGAAADETRDTAALDDSAQSPAIPEPDATASPLTAESGEPLVSQSVGGEPDSVSGPTEAATTDGATSQGTAQPVAAAQSGREQTVGTDVPGLQDEAALPRLADLLPPSPLDAMPTKDRGGEHSETDSAPFADLTDTRSCPAAATVAGEHPSHPAAAVDEDGASRLAGNVEPTAAAGQVTDSTETGNGAPQDDRGDAARQMWSEEAGTDDENTPGEVMTLPTPSFTLPTLDGQLMDQTAFKGHPTILIFWRPDCPHSQAVTPDLLALQSEIGDDGPRLVVVATCDSETAARHGFKSVTLLDPTFSLGQSLGLAGTPAAVLLGPDGEPFGQVGLGARAVLGMIRAACRAWAMLTNERQSSETGGAQDNEAGAAADTKTRLDLGPNPFERFAAEITPIHSVIVRRPLAQTGLLDELDAECGKEDVLQRQAG